MQSKRSGMTWLAGAVVAATLCFVAPHQAQAQVSFGVHVGGYGVPVAQGYYGGGYYGPRYDPYSMARHRYWEHQRWEAAREAQWRHEQWERSHHWSYSWHHGYGGW